MSPHLKFPAAIALSIALAACQQPAEPADEAAADSTAELKLPVSINAAMVGLVDHSADYIFAVGNGDLPKDDHDWDLVRSSAYETTLGGTIIQIPGTGQYDAGWVANPEWKKFATELTTIGTEAVALADARSTDVAQWRAIGDRLVDNCLACHAKFKPEIPSQGILHESTERESRGESVF